ncbi:MAG: hypothetical protein ACREM3_31565 [Candidatus Rokuibacteriota bacterium]
MRYRRLRYCSATMLRAGRTWPFADFWRSDRLRPPARARRRPDADETAITFVRRSVTAALAANRAGG